MHWPLLRASLASLVCLGAMLVGCSSPDRNFANGGQGGQLGGGGADQASSSSATSSVEAMTCVTDAQCPTGSCVDGFCCDTACDSDCMGCSMAVTGERDGTCAPVLAATDPHNNCAQESAKSCGLNGLCNGGGACAFYDATTVCEPSTCVDGVKTLARTCDGTGQCVGTETKACGDVGCDATGTVCEGECIDDDSCAPGQYCDPNGTCLDKSGNGEACTGAGSCASGFCVGGVCCDTACDGTCQACDTGVCANVPAGQDPAGDCAQETPESCGKTGQCDGAGSCQRYGTSTICAAGSCSGSTAITAKTCDGDGACANGGQTQSCDLGCKGDACDGGCTSTSCPSGQYCSGGTSCLAKKSNGGTCSANAECSSSHCVEGICCDTACTGACMACSAANKGQGTSGTCGPVKAGTDTKNNCQPSGTCGFDGECDGAGACRYVASGTSCGAASCSGSTLNKGSSCDGDGACDPKGTSSCSPYVCASSASCKTSCSTTNDCVSGYYCASGTCKVKLTNGTACTAASACSSGNCVDGVCCDKACNGTCEACSATAKGQGSSGTCGPIKKGTDPGNECTDGGASACGGNGMCNGAGACDVYASGSVCAAGVCKNTTTTSTWTTPGTCDGAGSGLCKLGTTTNCAPYACLPGSGCLTRCDGDFDCVGGGLAIAPEGNVSLLPPARHCCDGICQAMDCYIY